MVYEHYDEKEDYLFKNEEELKIAENKGPLLGKTIVLSGQLLIPKQYLIIILMNLGAKVVSTISGKTDILIHGNFLEDGRKYTEGKKYKAAKAKKIKIYSDKEFEKYMSQLLKKKWNMVEESMKY